MSSSKALQVLPVRAAVKSLLLRDGNAKFVVVMIDEDVIEPEYNGNVRPIRHEYGLMEMTNW
ncbi:hypothetical protein CVT26_005802 [Gymnopilus dilepis]|uniref:Uncharacterized protein n=1 Tax=Gymnopilus dilepis TaxID=231916 RepID=A0A409YL43_9AGAR|nr:hypothetical protein CVT26_005802 [Gymnopilus dilepis]